MPQGRGMPGQENGSGWGSTLIEAGGQRMGWDGEVPKERTGKGKHLKCKQTFKKKKRYRGKNNKV